MSRSGSLGAMPAGAVRRRLRTFGSAAAVTGTCGFLGAAGEAEFPLATGADVRTGAAAFAGTLATLMAAPFPAFSAGAFAEMPFTFAAGFRPDDAFVLVNVFVFR